MSQPQFKPPDEQYALARAYVPEHIPGLMQLISQGRPFLIEEYLGFSQENWLILVGYPLAGSFSPDHCQHIIEQVVAHYRPEYLWFIGPQIPPPLLESGQKRQSDDYYKLDVEQFRLKSALRRATRRAAEKLTVEQGHAFTPEHQALVTELVQRQEMPPLIQALYEAMPHYLAHSRSACLLNARDGRGHLSAFYVVEQAAHAFDTYVLGCYSKKNYVPYASDLLFWEMIELARAHGKKTINLGLGVNEGISRFKKKWGGQPFLKYEFCQWSYTRPKIRSLVNMFLEGKL